MKSLFLFSKGQSFLHRLDPRPKFLCVLAILSFVLIFSDPLFLMGAFVGVITIIWVFANISPIKYWKFLLFFSPLILAVAIIQSITYPGESAVLFSIGPVSFLTAGLFFGVSIGFRLATMGLTFMMFSMTTTPKNVGLAIHKLGIPFKYAYLTTIGLRFLPLMQEDLATLQDARAARGDSRVGSRNPLTKVQSLPKSFFPLAANSIRRSKETAMALELRGYGASRNRTTINDLSMTPVDYVVSLLSLGIFGLIVYTRFALGWGVIQT